MPLTSTIVEQICFTTSRSSQPFRIIKSGLSIASKRPNHGTSFARDSKKETQNELTHIRWLRICLQIVQIFCTLSHIGNTFSVSRHGENPGAIIPH